MLLWVWGWFLTLEEAELIEEEPPQMKSKLKPFDEHLLIMITLTSNNDSFQDPVNCKESKHLALVNA